MLTAKERKILELRAKKLTQTQIANELKISQAAVSSFERSAKRKIIDSKKTLLIAKNLDIEVEDENF